ncbi:uncharacterized protein LOC110975509 [Acanthaster planci]|uniref:Uncharacterized protein LOC110975509 n=1 Tax=Acanthaster planci TaxID=133434 RepID=A0A8B7XU36_ACAPL|nr:uncharacterized protein LOC110975509 [Acanthaster planci]
MKNFILFFLLLSCGTGIATALECYACRDCQPDFMDDRSGRVTETCPRDPRDRHDTLVRCSKHVEKDGKINRGCSTVTECTSRELISKCSDDTTGNSNIIETSCEICCDTNKCNSAAMVMANLTLSVFISLLLALYHV